MNIDEMIAVLQAAKEGKAIQIQINGEWVDTQPPVSKAEYRIKPAEKKLVPHWHAICVTPEYTYTTPQVYRSLKETYRLADRVLRLATEYPPIMLEVE